MSGSYSDLTAKQVYDAMHNKWSAKTLEQFMKLWIESENIMEVRAVCQEWFEALNDGTANNRYPDPTMDLVTGEGKPITPEYADKFVETLEDDFMIEKARFITLEVDTGPGFTRLEGPARLTFVHTVWQTMKTDEQLEKEAYERIKAGDLPDFLQYMAENTEE